MAYVITEPCIGTKDAACVDVCPVDCIHPRKDEATFEAAEMLYIHPDECIDCGACVPACPVEAIFALGFPIHFDWAWRTLWNRDWEDYVFAAAGGSHEFRRPQFKVWIGYDF